MGQGELTEYTQYGRTTIVLYMLDYLDYVKCEYIGVAGERDVIDHNEFGMIQVSIVVEVVSGQWMRCRNNCVSASLVVHMNTWRSAVISCVQYRIVLLGTEFGVCIGEDEGGLEERWMGTETRGNGEADVS
ncbi:hypothetical protein Tco_0286989 [Tanacetum coccineum]